MEKHGLDCWIVEFARETGNRPDPLGYLVGTTVTWPSAFLLHQDGRCLGYGVVGLEEQAIVDGEGASYLSNAQRELWILPRSVRPR